MNRRNLLKIGAAVAGVCVTGSYFYLCDEEMKRASPKNGKIIADLHCHPADYKNDKATLEMLCSSGLVGLSWINDDKDKKILTYEKVMERFPNLVQEINPGQLAKITHQNQTGYFARTQEITGDTHHVLAVGWEGDYLPNYDNARVAIEEIRKRNGIAFLCHPYVTPNKDSSVIKYRFMTAEEEEIVEVLGTIVDEIEIFNAQCINPTLGIVVPNMKRANKLAEDLAIRNRINTGKDFLLLL